MFYYILDWTASDTASLVNMAGLILADFKWFLIIGGVLLVFGGLIRILYR